MGTRDARADGPVNGPWPRRRPDLEAAFYAVCVLVVITVAVGRFVLPWLVIR